jgi:drug/metabolite transporter (DMT)-like permease
MSFVVAVSCGVASALAYAAATAIEHDAANTGTGEHDPQGLLRLLTNPRWLLGFFGDFVGLVFQVIALSAGTVVLVQPILVLSLPMSLPISWILGGPRPRRRDYLASAIIIVGLTGFFLLIGHPAQSHALHRRHALSTVTIALAAGGIASLAVRGRSAPLRAAVYGAVAGAWFGLVGVLLDAATTTWRERGVRGFTHPPGFVPLLGVLVIGALSIVLTQLSFQVGTLGASFPANLAAAPVVAVILGAVLLREHVPVSAPIVAGYLACLVAVIIGAFRLADQPQHGSTQPQPG